MINNHNEREKLSLIQWCKSTGFYWCKNNLCGSVIPDENSYDILGSARFLYGTDEDE